MAYLAGPSKVRSSGGADMRPSKISGWAPSCEPARVRNAWEVPFFVFTVGPQSEPECRQG